MAKKKKPEAQATCSMAAVMQATPVRVWEVSCGNAGFPMPTWLCEAETEEVAREKYRVKWGIRRTDLEIECKPVG